MTRCTRSGVKTRASKPNASRRGEKVPTTVGTFRHAFFDGQMTVDGSDSSFLEDRLTASTAAGTSGRIALTNGDLLHLLRLDLLAELPPQLMSAGLDHRIVRNSNDGSLSTIQGDGNFGRLAE
jgi:hypothetical protein